MKYIKCYFIAVSLLASSALADTQFERTEEQIKMGARHCHIDGKSAVTYKINLEKTLEEESKLNSEVSNNSSVDGQEKDRLKYELSRVKTRLYVTREYIRSGENLCLKQAGFVTEPRLSNCYRIGMQKAELFRKKMELMKNEGKFLKGASTWDETTKSKWQDFRSQNLSLSHTIQELEENTTSYCFLEKE